MTKNTQETTSENSQDFSFTMFAPARISTKAPLAKTVIKNFLTEPSKPANGETISAKEFEYRYGMAEAIGIENVDIDDLDAESIPVGFPMPKASFKASARTYNISLDNQYYGVCLSGRAGFYRAYHEKKDKVQLTSYFNEEDTCDRFFATLMAVKQASLHHFSCGRNYVVPLIFNGVKRQNNELQEITRTQESFNNFILKNGYSEDYFYPVEAIRIIDIPLDNTLGQVISLSAMIENEWPLICETYNINHEPTLFAYSSSYHVPRIESGICAISPILSPEYWANKQKEFNRLPNELQAHVLKEYKLFQHANISVFGCDPHISEVYAWDADMPNDMEALFNYGCFNGSIAAHPSANITTHLKVEAMRALRKASFFNKPPCSDQVEEEHNKNVSDTSNPQPLLLLEF